MSIRFVAEAERDLDDAVAFYQSRRTGLGIEFAAAVERPKAWHPLSRRTRRYRLSRFPYSVVYHIMDDGILVLAVAHHSRRPGIWKYRVSAAQP